MILGLLGVSWCFHHRRGPVKLTLREQLTKFAQVMQSALFPALEEQVGEMDPTARRSEKRVIEIPTYLLIRR